jgi:hypothetical protein
MFHYLVLYQLTNFTIRSLANAIVKLEISISFHADVNILVMASGKSIGPFLSQMVSARSLQKFYACQHNMSLLAVPLIIGILL